MQVITELISSFLQIILQKLYIETKLTQKTHFRNEKERLDFDEWRKDVNEFHIVSLDDTKTTEMYEYN